MENNDKMHLARKRLSYSLPKANLSDYDIQSEYLKEFETMGGVILFNYQQSLSKFSEESLLKICIQILKKPYNQRTENQIKIISQMTQKLQFFRTIKRSYGALALQACLKCIQHQSVSDGEVIFRVGQKGQRFYIILEGLIGIYISQPTLKDKTIFEKKKVNQLGPGGSFGELALLYKDSKRSATVIACSDGELAYMDQIDYESVIGEFQREKISQKIEFLSQQPWLHQWSKREIQTLSYHFVYEKYDANDIVFSEGDISQEIFLVKQGLFEMTKQYSKQNINSVKMKEIPAELRLKHRIPTIKTICSLEYGQIFGEECFIYDEKFRLKFRTQEINKPLDRITTVHCKSLQGELFRIKKTDMEQRFWDFQTIQIFTKTLQIIVDHRTERMSNIRSQLNEENQKLKTFYEKSIFDKTDTSPKFKYKNFEDQLYMQEIKVIKPPQIQIDERFQKMFNRFEILDKQSSPYQLRTLSVYTKEATKISRKNIANSPRQIETKEQRLKKIITNLTPIKDIFSLPTDVSNPIDKNQISSEHIIQSPTTIKSERDDSLKNKQTFYNQLMPFPKKKGLIALSLNKREYLLSLSARFKKNVVTKDDTKDHTKHEQRKLKSQSVQHNVLDQNPTNLASDSCNESMSTQRQMGGSRLKALLQEGSPSFKINYLSKKTYKPISTQYYDVLVNKEKMKQSI